MEIFIVGAMGVIGVIITGLVGVYLIRQERAENLDKLGLPRNRHSRRVYLIKCHMEDASDV